MHWGAVQLYFVGPLLVYVLGEELLLLRQLRGCCSWWPWRWCLESPLFCALVLSCILLQLSPRPRIATIRSIVQNCSQRCFTSERDLCCACYEGYPLVRSFVSTPPVRCAPPHWWSPWRRTSRRCAGRFTRGRLLLRALSSVAWAAVRIMPRAGIQLCRPRRPVSWGARAGGGVVPAERRIPAAPVNTHAPIPLTRAD